MGWNNLPLQSWPQISLLWQGSLHGAWSFPCKQSIPQILSQTWPHLSFFSHFWVHFKSELRSFLFPHLISFWWPHSDESEDNISTSHPPHISPHSFLQGCPHSRMSLSHFWEHLGRGFEHFVIWNVRNMLLFSCQLVPSMNSIL